MQTRHGFTAEQEAVLKQLPGAAQRQEDLLKLPGASQRSAGSSQQDLKRENWRRNSAKRREMKARQAQEAEERRNACHAKLPGRNQKHLPESMRMLYGGSQEAEERRDRVFRRAVEVDDYLQSYRFRHCDFCERGWFGTDEQAPCGVSTNDGTEKVSISY